MWIGLHFTDFSLQVAARGAPAGTPLAVSTGGVRPTVLCTNAPATRAGVRAGVSVAAARALVTGLGVFARNPLEEKRSLENLAGWAHRFTSHVSVFAPDALVLEAGGSVRLFGGWAKLLAVLREEIADLGYSAVASVAPTPLAALWLARAGLEADMARPHETAALLSPLPAAFLDAPPMVLEALAAAGAKTLGDVMALPRDGVARRFGQAVLDQIDRALGRLPDSPPAFTPPVRFESVVELAAEVENTEALLFPLRRMLGEMTAFLAGRGAGVLRFTLLLLHSGRVLPCPGLPGKAETQVSRGGVATKLEIGVSRVSRDAAQLLSLLRERLDRQTLPAPVRTLALLAGEALPYQPHHGVLFPGPALQEEKWGGLLDRLRARLGEDAVQTLTPVADHRPERAQTASPAPSAATVASGIAAKRPFWLLEAPQPLLVRDGRLWLNEGPLSLTSGPERIEAGWWDDAPAKRDYWFAADGSGTGYWVFRDDIGWYLHGYCG